MRFFLPLLLVTLQVNVCSSAANSATSTKSIPASQAVTSEDVIVLGDSICADVGHPAISYPGWPTVLEKLSGVNIDSYCIAGIQLSEFDFESRFAEAGVKYKYAVINLGFNDIMKKKALDAIIEQYSSTLNYIESKGIEPVCFIYKNSKREIEALSAAITSLCTRRHLLLIHSASNTVDGVHLSAMAQIETAIGASHVLFAHK